MFKGKIQIPLFFHNANYDIRQFINSFHDLNKNDETKIKNISGVPCNMEFFKCLQLNNIVIKDSYAHMTSSLDKLIKKLPENKKLRLKSIVGNDEELFKLVDKKGFYPYEFVDNIDKLNTPLSELKPHHFNSKLTLFKLEELTTDTEDESLEKRKIWLHIQTVIKTFNMKTLKDYRNRYLKIDGLGLTDVMEHYRETAYVNYGLDLAHYVGLPS